MKTGPKPKTEEQAVEEAISRAIRVENGCLLLLHGVSVGIGYKLLSCMGHQEYAHRLVFKVKKGPIFGKVIRHTCDTPNCIEENHLIDGTHTDNANDKFLKRRHTYGESHPNAKLTWEKVNEIRSTPNPKLQELSDKYGVSRGTILQILEYKIWRG